MADDDSGSGLHLFGTNLAKITCYRESLMSGIGGGFMTGIAYFLFSSNAKKATNVGFSGFIGLTVVAWTICRARAVPPLSEKDLRQAVKTKILIEGTERDNQYRAKIESETKDV